MRILYKIGLGIGFELAQELNRGVLRTNKNVSRASTLIVVGWKSCRRLLIHLTSTNEGCRVIDTTRCFEYDQKRGGIID